MLYQQGRGTQLFQNVVTIYQLTGRDFPEELNLKFYSERVFPCKRSAHSELWCWKTTNDSL